ncbi:unnamed protein product [Knipowitschia caucasica]|uniref:Liver-expressed antimicrobial peptide 2 n=1 Tax=Knipowitschia caucasica TaxID=637954 RepID=A0AAV2KLG2_KNICA
MDQRKCAALLLVWTLAFQQVCSSPVVSVGGSLSLIQSQTLQTQQTQQRSQPQRRRTARMSPLWRINNSKPFGAYCQNGYECLSGICRGGFCATVHRTATVSVVD